MSDVEVKVTYKYVDNPSVDSPFTVDIEIDIEPGPELGSYRIFMADACLCKGFHRVYWTQKGEPVDLSQFTFHNIPAQIHCQGPEKVAGRWTALVDNSKGVAAVNGITYTFECNRRPVNFTHDPTIAVTNDPPPGGVLV